jgi:hypothetical protein
MTSSATGPDPNAHSSDTDFGAENVTSNAFTDRCRSPANRSSPVDGCFPSTIARRSSASTSPTRPSRSAQRPDHTPGASPTPA